MADDATFTSGDIARAETSAAEASPAPHPQSAEPTAAAPTSQPAATEPTTDNRVPLDEHKRVIEGFHDRLDRLSWARDLDRDRVTRAMELADLYEKDPGRLYQNLGARVSKEPAPDVQDERGDWYYSPQQAAKLARYQAAQEAADVRRDLDARLGPIEQRDQQAQVLDTLTNQIQTAANWPGFADHVDAITAAIAENNQARRRDPSLPKLTLNDAYIQVAVPKLAAARQSLEADIRKQVVAELQSTSAAARDDINPGRSPAAAHKKPSNFKEALEQEFAKATGR